ncbi:MAG TPA: PilN domain-containing protein [Candidatus Saccharimonadia bacterium]|nr:PilN domain-containing protein [Candidatus Saccharimonadia bacterium]
MINLLPPDLKEQIRYAKLNQLVLRYLRISIVVVIVLGVIFVGAFYMIGQQTAAVASGLAAKQQVIAQLNSTFVPEAQSASDRLTAIKYVQSTQTHFSAVISDLAKVLPQGVSIDSITLTGDDALPVDVAMTAQTYNEALAVRNALATSPRIANADLESISSNTTDAYQVTVVIAFKPGQAK